MMQLVDMTIGHLIEFRKTVRDIDLEEIEAISGVAFDDQLVSLLAGSQTLIDQNGVVLGIGGVEDNNVIWLVTTTAIEDRKVEFLRFSRKYLKDLLDEYGYLGNIAYLKNQLHINWLKWLGAEWMDTDGDFLVFKFKRKE